MAEPIHRTRGDHWSIEGGLLDADGDPVDLTDATVRAHLRVTAEDPDPVALFDVTKLDPHTGGRVRLELDPAVTQQLDPVTHVYDIEVTADGKPTTYGAGSELVVEADATWGAP